MENVLKFIGAWYLVSVIFVAIMVFGNKILNKFFERTDVKYQNK